MLSLMPPLLDPLPLPEPNSIRVPTALYRRHLGLPACAELDERLEVLADQASRWYEQHGRPWVSARQIAIQRFVYDVIHLDDQLLLTSSLLSQGLRRADAHALVVVGISAGREVDQQVDQLWKNDRPDEAMFLSAYAIAIVEHLRWQVGDQLRQAGKTTDTTVLPHYSPGYEGWGLADQSRLFRLIRHNASADALPIELLPSGGLSPNKSTLATFGLTQRTDLDENLDQYWDCRAIPSSPADASASYAFPERTLTRWRDKRLNVTALANDQFRAIFRLDGSTCTNMGIPLQFDYVVELQKEADNSYRITHSDCRPTENHNGYQSMCAYLDKPERYMSQLEAYRPLVGRPLHEALGWDPPTSPAGCLCTRASQDHKWRIVLHTLHYALENS